jgi:hypothetical protein
LSFLADVLRDRPEDAAWPESLDAGGH